MTIVDSVGVVDPDSIVERDELTLHLEETMDEAVVNGDGGLVEARSYQIELLEAALEANTIVLLGTGAGKTFIAVMLIKHMSAPTLLPLQEKEAKRSVFLVNTGK